MQPEQAQHLQVHGNIPCGDSTEPENTQTRHTTTHLGQRYTPIALIYFMGPNTAAWPRSSVSAGSSTAQVGNMLLNAYMSESSNSLTLYFFSRLGGSVSVA